MEDGFSCILHFLKFSGGAPRTPTYKGSTSIKPSSIKPLESFFNNNSSQKQKKKKKKKKKAGKAFPLY